MNGDNRSSHFLGCIIGAIVALMLIIWFFYGCDNWMMPGGLAGQYKAYRDCQKKDADCGDVYNIMGSPSD